MGQEANSPDGASSPQLLFAPPVHLNTMSLASKPAVSCMSSSESDQPEIERMRRIREGDMEAFKLLVETHQSRIVGTIIKMLGSGLEADDLAPQVFIPLLPPPPP